MLIWVLAWRKYVYSFYISYERASHNNRSFVNSNKTDHPEHSHNHAVWSGPRSFLSFFYDICSAVFKTFCQQRPWSECTAYLRRNCPHMYLIHMPCNVRKRSFWHVRPTRTKISLRIRAVWFESSLSALTNVASWLSKISLAKVLIRLRECAVWSDSPLGAHVRRYVFWRWCSINLHDAHILCACVRACLCVYVCYSTIAITQICLIHLGWKFAYHFHFLTPDVRQRAHWHGKGHCKTCTC